MPTILELCEKYYGTRDVYKLMGISKDALVKDVKKAYYKLSLQVHPDRVSEEEKEVATEKFKVLSKLNELLSDSDKRALYDEKGVIEDDDDETCSWMDLWKQFFKPITTNDIDNYQREYKGSELEKTDLKKAYIRGKGCINYLMESVPFMEVEDESRINEIIQDWIKSGEVDEFKAFTEEPASKRNRRHKKYAREAREARSIANKKEPSNTPSLEQQIALRQKERGNSMASFFDKLMDKYADMDDDEEFSLDDAKDRKKYKKVVGSTTKKAASQKTKGGRVQKAKK